MKTTKILFATLVLGLFLVSCNNKNKSLKGTKWIDQKAYTTLEFTSDSECVFSTEGGFIVEAIRETTDTVYQDNYDENDNYLGQEVIINEAGAVYKEYTEDRAIVYSYEYKYPDLTFTLEEGACGVAKSRTGTINEDEITISRGDKVILTLTKEKKK